LTPLLIAKVVKRNAAKNTRKVKSNVNVVLSYLRFNPQKG
jgi:hypothetical protein